MTSHAFMAIRQNLEKFLNQFLLTGKFEFHISRFGFNFQITSVRISILLFKQYVLKMDILISIWRTLPLIDIWSIATLAHLTPLTIQTLFIIKLTVVFINVLNQCLISIYILTNLAQSKLHHIHCQRACLIWENYPYLAKLFIQTRVVNLAHLEGCVFTFFINCVEHLNINADEPCLADLDNLNCYEQRYWNECAVQAKYREEWLDESHEVWLVF